MINVVVTGASKGIGKAIAKIFIKHGANVCICSRNSNNLQETFAEFKPLLHSNAQLNYTSCDVSKKEEVYKFTDFVKSKFSKIDVLVNNAGVFIPGKISEEPDGNLEFLMHTNLYSAYQITRNLLPLMLPYQQGHIFNICSVASIMAYPNGGSYAISKFALYGFSKSLREELKYDGIKVCSVLPGATFTDSWKGTDVHPERLMPAEDVASMIWATTQLSSQSDVEDIILRPQLGDL